jgi:DNA polymerase-3 subunit gamma/tau
VVARRYRPQTFDQLIGQQMVARAMRNAIQTDRVGHAYLFTGARGVGKTSAARILAKALNCVRGPAPDPCNACDICLGIASGDDMDVLEIDGASNRGIDEIRQLRSNVNVRPSRARFKIYIIDEVHMLTREAFNALLKTLEEPPEHVKFVFCTTDPEKIPITVLSRCQRYDFAPVETLAIADRLGQIAQAEGARAEPEALQLLARRAAGSMRDSQSLLEQLLAFAGDEITVDSVHHMLGTAATGRLRALVNHLIARDAAAALAELDAAVQEGVDLGQLTEQLLGYLRDLMALSVGCGVELMLHSTDADQAALQDAAQRWGVETILAAVQIVDQTVARMRQSAHGRTLAEMAIVRIARLEDLQALPELIAQLRGEGGTLQVPAGRLPAPGQSPAASPAGPAGGDKKKTDLGSELANAPGLAHASPAAVGTSESPGADAAATSPVDPESWAAMSDEAATQLWRKALDELNDMTADFARRFQSVASSAPNRLVVHFAPKYNSSKTYCERPERQKRLEQALAKVCGGTVRVELRVREGATDPSQPARRVVPLRQRIRETHSHPLVQQAVKLFGAEVSSVDLPSSDD